MSVRRTSACLPRILPDQKEKFSDELLAHIFSFLVKDVSTYRAVSLVCRKWRWIASDLFTPYMSCYRCVLRDRVEWMPNGYIQLCQKAAINFQSEEPFRLNCTVVGFSCSFHVIYYADCQAIFYEQNRQLIPFVKIDSERDAGHIIFIGND